MIGYRKNKVPPPVIVTRAYGNFEVGHIIPSMSRPVQEIMIRRGLVAVYEPPKKRGRPKQEAEDAAA